MKPASIGFFYLHALTGVVASLGLWKNIFMLKLNCRLFLIIFNLSKKCPLDTSSIQKSCYSWRPNLFTFLKLGALDREKVNDR